MTALAFHPLATLFPLMVGEEFDALAADIKANGLQEPIVLHEDGSILDGRNRYRACAAAGVDARMEMFRGRDALAFVISKNLNRRHLNESQRAMVAARLATMRQGERTDLKPSAKLPKVAQDEAAAALKVSPRLVRSAKVVQDKATPELQRVVDQGKLAVSAAAKAATLEPELQAKIVEHAESGRMNSVQTVIKASLRRTKEMLLGRKVSSLPDRRYSVIVADPEWEHKTWSESGMLKSAGNHYPTSPTEEIAARDVPRIAASDCVLFLWAVVPMLPDAVRVMEAWGFTYKSHFIWEKEYPGEQHGTGYWARIDHELFLIGTRGNIPAPAPGTQWRSIIRAPWAGRHSAKPERFLELVETYFPTLPKIELNRRGPARPGWDAWGNEAESVDGAAA